jgi:hypothetical protein
LRAWCRSGLIVRIAPGRSKDWVKVKNRKHPAFSRVQDAFS